MGPQDDRERKLSHLTHSDYHLPKIEDPKAMARARWQKMKGVGLVERLKKLRKQNAAPNSPVSQPELPDSAQFCPRSTTDAGSWVSHDSSTTPRCPEQL